MNLIIALTLLLTACVSRSPAQITTVPNPFRVEDAPATAGPTAAVPEADNDNAEPTEDAPPTGDVPEENPALIKLPRADRRLGNVDRHQLERRAPRA